MDNPPEIDRFVKSENYRRALELPPRQTEEYRFLAQGEYNKNYLFRHPLTGKKLVLRLNFGSQMGLSRQIDYEYGALKLLERSGRTPAPRYVDGSLKDAPFGVLVMDWLPGRPPEYGSELLRAAPVLADIHSVPVPSGTFLLAPKNPMRAILEECETMVKVYMDWPGGGEHVKKKLRRLLDAGWTRADTAGHLLHRCCVNTELNNTNFLVNDGGTDFLVDWEKPLYSDPAQDLGHYLAPTTTFWKTDVILTSRQTESFIDEYLRCAAGRFCTSRLRERTLAYIPVTCLRGVTWCAMAQVEYQRPDRPIFNPSTFKKLSDYLDSAFLARIGALLGVEL